MNRRVCRQILLSICIVGIVLSVFVISSVTANAAVTAGGRWVSQDGKSYFMESDGTISKGWLLRNGHKYYLDRRTGEKVTGWQIIDGKRYYFHRKGGRAATGWFNADGERYYAFSNGMLKTGWFSEQGERFYLSKEEKGAMQTGWTTIEGKQYFFYPDGRLAVKVWLDESHYVDDKGVFRSDVVRRKEYTFRWPLDPSWREISSPFGYRGSVTVGTSDHNGIDIPASMDTPIYAGRTGVIIKREYNDSEGNYIEIDHQNGLVTEYMHMSRFSDQLQVGSRVQRGQVIGYVGSTGWSTGAHLHFGVKMNGVRVDPLGFVRQP